MNSGGCFETPKWTRYIHGPHPKAKLVADLLTIDQRWILLQTLIVTYAPHWHPDDIKTLLELELVYSDGDGLRVTEFGERVRFFTTTTGVSA